jgi:hypothetical protein
MRVRIILTGLLNFGEKSIEKSQIFVLFVSYIYIMFLKTIYISGTSGLSRGFACKVREALIYDL